jgi:DNA (cytosine-5)-methyltransferase 1
MRMFSAQERRAPMGFPVDYKLPVQHRLAMDMLRNAVYPPAARDLIPAFKEAV